jgi:tetratricopeptide (TPR) repeat protein
MKITIYIILAFVLSLSISFAQKDKEFIKKGNSQYKDKKFNLGDALYKQEQYDKAAQEFANIANKKISEDITSSAYHNLGNSYLQQRKLEESINAYKNSLRINPDDKETKYNLEYAKKLLVQQQQQQQQNKNEKNQDKKNQDKNQQQQNQDNKDNKDNKDKQNQQNQPNEQMQDDKQQQQQAQEQKISEKDAERILQALNQEEKKLQEKLKKKVKGVRGQPLKKW